MEHSTKRKRRTRLTRKRRHWIVFYMQEIREGLESLDLLYTYHALP